MNNWEVVASLDEQLARYGWMQIHGNFEALSRCDNKFGWKVGISISKLS